MDKSMIVRQSEFYAVTEAYILANYMYLFT